MVAECCRWWNKYLAWRDADTRSCFLWYLKAFLTGVNFKFILCFIIGVVGVAELPYWRIIFANSANTELDISRLQAAICGAMPALIGATLLEYIIEEPKPRSVLLFAILCGVASLFVCFCEQHNLSWTYFATLITMFLAWCIRAHDKRYSLDKDQMTEKQVREAPEGGSVSTPLMDKTPVHVKMLKR